MRRQCNKLRSWCGFPKNSTGPSRPAIRPARIYKIGEFYSSADETLEKNGWLPNRNRNFGVANVAFRTDDRCVIGACELWLRHSMRGCWTERNTRATVYGWLVFALAFGLLISDYMARQVLNAVFPLLKAEWALSDAQFGWLSGVVALMVGLLTPLSLFADRWGRVKSLTLMAVLWSIATLLCAAATSYPQMLIGRILVGVGEAAYGSVGIALVISVFPSRMRATLSAAFMAGGLFGQVLGVAIGGEIAASYGWRAAFMAIGIAGLVLAIFFPACRQGKTRCKRIGRKRL